MLLLAAFATGAHAAGFVVNNGAPQTGVVVGQGSGNDTVTASGVFTGSYAQNPGNIYSADTINIFLGANILSPNIQPFITNNIYTFTGTNGLTYTNVWYHQPIISFIHGAFTNNGVLNYTNNALPPSTALDVYDIFPAGSAPDASTNRYVYHGEGVFVDIGNVTYGGPATLVNGSSSNTNAVISSVVTGSGQEIAEAVHAEARYSNNARTPDITFLNYGSVLGCSSNCINGSASGYNGYTLYGGQTIYNGPSATATALAPYDTTALYAFSYYGDVNLTQAGTATAVSTGGRAGNTAGLATAVGVDIYTYNGQINLTNSGTITAIASATNTANANAVFVWSENQDTNVTGGFTFINTGTIIAIATNSPNANSIALYGGCDGGIVNLVNTGTVIANTTGGGWAWGTENDRAENIYIYNSGTISHNTGLGVFVFGQPGGKAFITNTATGSIYGGNEGIAAENFTGDITIYNYGSVIAGSDNNNAMDLGSGNDTVHLYGLPKIVGWMNGLGGTNVLDFQLTGVLQQVNGSPATLGNNLSAYNLGTSGNITVSGQNYKWSNFNVTGTATTNSSVGPVYKAATGTDLTAGASWTGGIPPDVGNVACWTNTSLGAGLTMNSVISCVGIRVAGAASDIAISGSGPLALGTNGVDMSVSPVNLSMNVPVLLGGNQSWNVNSGENLNISGVISGNYGLLKAGAGLLVLSNANTFSGGTTVNGGTLALDYNVNDQPTGTLAAGSTLTVSSGGILRLDIEDALGFSGGSLAQLNINGGVVTSADVANSTPIQFGGTSFRVTLPTVNFQGGTLSSGINNQGDRWGGSYLIGNINTLSNTTTAVINAYSISLSGGTFTVAAGSTPSGVDLQVSSLLRNWDSGGDTITKAGAGLMELDQNSTPYNYPVIVNGGTLFLNGTLGTGGVNVAANGKFLAQGSLNGAITVATGGTFGVGYTNINTLSSFSTVTFNSGATNYMKISKNGNLAQSDQVRNLTSVTLSGTLVVSNITSDANILASGDTFSFFPSATAYHGNFSSVVLPALPVGLGWNISQLASGIITVSSSAAPPTFSPAPGGYAGALTVTISSLTPGATIYYTTDGSTPTVSSPHGITPAAVVLPANTKVTIQAFAQAPGYLASSVQSAAYSTYTDYIWANPAGGNWSGTANWSNNAVANGVGMPADFSELTLIGSPTVTLDIAATVGSLTFGDQGNANSWTLADGGAGPLTLAATNQPIIAVSNQTTTISAVLAGTSGFVKTGSGALVLDNQNVNTGPLVISNGTVALAYNAGDNPPGTLAAGTTNTVNAGGTLLMNIQDAMGFGNGSTAQLNINGGLVTSADVANTIPVNDPNTPGGTSFRVTLPTVNFTGGTLSSGTNNQGDNYGGSYLLTGVNTVSNSTTAVINAYSISLLNSPFNVAAGSTASGVDLSIASALRDWVSGAQTLTKNGNGVMTLSGANTYSGGTSLNGGILNLANVSALGAAGTSLNFNATAAAELSTDVGFGGTNPVYNVSLTQTGTYVGTMILNRATPGASTPITHNFGALTLSLNYGTPTALNVLAGPNAPTGGAVDTLAFSSVNFGNWYNVTETIAPTNANVVIAGPAAAVASQAGSTQVATLDLDGTSLGNQIAGAISDNPSGSGLNQAAILKSNSGTWTLSGTNTYSGNTTISGGTLALAGSGSIASSPSITIAGGATFDVSGLSSPFVLGSTQTLNNSSSPAVFKGNASAGTGTMALNFASGTPALTVTNGTLTLSSSTVFQINNTGSQLAVGSYPVIATVTGGVVGGTVTTNAVPVSGGGAAASAKLTIVNGQLNLVVGNPVNTTPTNLVASVSGGQLTLQWPSDHTGWTLQSNAVSLINTSAWYNVPGSASTNTIIIPINTAQTNVFYRMTYP